MNAHLIRIFLLLTIPLAISAVVKIDISPVKETKDSIEANVTTLMSTSITAAAEATTITSISSVTTTNMSIWPTQMTTTNRTGTMENETVRINATTPTLMVDATSLAQLPESTIRMMRRKFTNYDYYCPCDFKVRSARIPSVNLGK